MAVGISREPAVSSFWVDLLSHPFLQTAVLAGVLASVASGMVGTYVVVRRITYIAGGISHCVLGGLGAAGYLQVVWGVTWATPTRGALLAALLSAAIIGLVSLRARQREDTVIGALWSIGMAAGVLFISQTPGYAQDLSSYLFGNILMATPEDVWQILLLDVVVLAAVGLFHRQLLAVCFDEEFARMRGVRSELFYLLLLMLVAVTVVLLVKVVGIILMIAVLTLPAAVAGALARTVAQTMALAVLIGAALIALGLAISYQQNLPAGATIVVLSGVVYLVSAAIGASRRA